MRAAAPRSKGRPRRRRPGMPQTTLVASSCAITLPPAATMSAAPCGAVGAHAGEHDARAPRRPRFPPRTRTAGSTAGLQKLIGGAIVEHDHGVAVAARHPHVPVRPARHRCWPARIGSPSSASRARRPVARARCSARMVVKVGGMCWVIRTGARSITGPSRLHDRGQRLRSAGRRADHQNARRDIARERPQRKCGPRGPAIRRRIAAASTRQAGLDAARLGAARGSARRARFRARGSSSPARGGNSRA